MDREQIMAVLYDIALVIGGEVNVKPLLTKTLQRLLYHTSYPTGLVFLDVPDIDTGNIEVTLDVAIGDFGFAKLIGQRLTLPAAMLRGGPQVCEAPDLMAALPDATRRYSVCLRLPIDHCGVLLLLAPRRPSTQLPLTEIFRPVMANLAKAIMLCQHNEAYAAGLVTERDQAKQSQAESEEKFHSMAMVAQDAIVMIDDEGRVAYWNPAAERFFGYDADEAIGQDAHTLIAPGRYRQRFHEGFMRFLNSGEGPVVGRTIEIEGQRKDGSEFPVELSISALRLRDRWHAVGLLRDITERRKAEAALRQSEDSLKEAQRIASIGNWDLDLVRNKLIWSDEIYRIFEIDPAIFGASYEAFLDAIHPDDRVLVDTAYTTSVKDKTGYNIVHRLQMRDGRVKYVNERGETFYTAAGTPIRSVGTVQDITERREAELALHRANRALKTLSGCNGILVRATEEMHLLDDICTLIVEAGGYRGACVGYANDDGSFRVRPVTSSGVCRDDMDALEYAMATTPDGIGPATRAFLSGEVQLIHDLAGLGEEIAHRVGINSMIAMPLLDEGKSFGVLKVYAAENEAFDDQELALLKELSEDLAFGIITLRDRREQERLEAAEHQGAERLKRALLGTIQAVAITVEKRDPYTAGHQQKVARLAVAIARELNWPPELIEGVRLGAMIHDIGKIYVPSEILNRPGKLSDLEFGIIKSHPEVGYEILEGVEFPWPVAQIILQHHERLDGSGYPKGLLADQIIPEARVLAVADVVEAMAAHRPYRAALGLAVGLEEITLRSGTLFDPEIVGACLRVFRERGFKLDET